MGLAPDDPTPTQALAQRLCAHAACATLIVTLGAQGALVLDDDGMRTVAGVGVDVVDTTGAGDAFNSGLAVALAEGRSLDDAVRYANCAGALACTRLGVIPALAAARRRGCPLCRRPTAADQARRPNDLPKGRTANVPRPDSQQLN